MQNVKVSLAERSYDIRIGSGLIQSAGDIAAEAIGTKRKLLVVSNPTVHALYGDTLLTSLRQCYDAVRYVEIPDGEEFKAMPYAERVLDAAVDFRMDRQDAVVALGGGVIGDLAGFAAAIYLRGVPFVQVPTTLLAQVDSSVGGKVAVNHARGKNLIGAFHQPKLVIIDPDVLATLPEREYTAGLAEVVKYGIILSEPFFTGLEAQCAPIQAMQPEVLEGVIAESCRIKAHIVEGDEREESGLREVLNLGHTFGHAIENRAGYGVYRHGEAVAIGIRMAAQLAYRMGLLGEPDAHRIMKLIHNFGLDLAIPRYPSDEMMDLMRGDKKNRAGEIRFVLPAAIGKTVATANVPMDLVTAILEQG
ncbi:MAG: 3-dehydroquinate synthase [Solirubrobacterales bacterium]